MFAIGTQTFRTAPASYAVASRMAVTHGSLARFLLIPRGLPCSRNVKPTGCSLRGIKLLMETKEGRVTGKSLGVAACTAIVVGNMVGSGFYLSPAAVAPFGNLAILAWIVMGAGAVCLGLTFAKLARLVPATGGPYAYTRMAYGDFTGFLIAWGYWISIWASLPVIAIAFAGAIFDLVPALHNRTMAVVLTLGAIWAVVLVNLRGVKAAGMFSQVTTYSKLIPFAAIALFGLFFIAT